MASSAPGARWRIFGGTRFVGRHIAESALERGHQVTVFHRGQTGADALPDATHVLGDRDHDLNRLAEGTWDVTVDACAYVPRQVDELCRVLGRALYNLVVTLDLQRISLGGSVFWHHRAWLLPRLQAELRGKLPALTDHCGLVSAGLGERVGDFGALALVA